MSLYNVLLINNKKYKLKDNKYFTMSEIICTKIIIKKYNKY